MGLDLIKGEIKAKFKNLIKFEKNVVDSPDKRKQNFFSKVEDIQKAVQKIDASGESFVYAPIIIQLPNSEEVYGANYLEVPDEFKKRLISQYAQLPSKRKNIINIVENDFLERLLEFKQFYFKEDPTLKKVLNYALNPSLRSVLKLSGFVKIKFDNAKRAEAQRTKDEISLQYGQWGRRICNLYVRGYLTNMTKEYLDLVLDDPDFSEQEKSEKLNEIFDRAINFWEHVYFIHHNFDINTTVEEISGLIELEKPYIAIHAAGQNIKIAEEILKQIDKKRAKKLGYLITPDKCIGKAKCRIFDVLITKTEITK